MSRWWEGCTELQERSTTDAPAYESETMERSHWKAVDDGTSTMLNVKSSIGGETKADSKERGSWQGHTTLREQVFGLTTTTTTTLPKTLQD